MCMLLDRVLDAPEGSRPISVRVESATSDMEGTELSEKLWTHQPNSDRGLYVPGVALAAALRTGQP